MQLGGAGGRPTTPTYAQPSFPPNQATAPGGGYDYPGPSNDFPAPSGPAPGASYPQAGRPTGPSSFGGPTGGSPYPAAGVPATFPSAAGPAAGIRPGVGPAAVGPTGGFGAAPGVGIGGGNIPVGAVGTGGPAAPSNGVQNDDTSEGDYSAIPGTPDVDYPIYTEIPETSFDCNQQQYPGEKISSSSSSLRKRIVSSTILTILTFNSHRLLCRC